MLNKQRKNEERRSGATAKAAPATDYVLIRFSESAALSDGHGADGHERPGRRAGEDGEGASHCPRRPAGHRASGCSDEKNYQK